VWAKQFLPQEAMTQMHGNEQRYRLEPVTVSRIGFGAMQRWFHALAVTDIACVQNPMNLADRRSLPVLEECEHWRPDCCEQGGLPPAAAWAAVASAIPPPQASQGLVMTGLVAVPGSAPSA
jgi:hypothetical protein